MFLYYDLVESKLSLHGDHHFTYVNMNRMVVTTCPGPMVGTRTGSLLGPCPTSVRPREGRVVVPCRPVDVIKLPVESRDVYHWSTVD